APANSTEEAMAAIWSEVLRRERISTHDNFFDLGGHSLMATQVVSRIREKFHVQLAMRILFEHPTICGLALAIEAEKNSGELMTNRPSCQLSGRRIGRAVRDVVSGYFCSAVWRELFFEVRSTRPIMEVDLRQSPLGTHRTARPGNRRILHLRNFPHLLTETSMAVQVFYY
ncbi:MAG TPA: phosphopantetheine-binding protein, partial [Terriglobales bacterium]|nr:phosphopantetheine-binding protein [Terriglobales bacterium]